MKNNYSKLCLYKSGNQLNGLSLTVRTGGCVRTISLYNRAHNDNLASNHDFQLMRVPTDSSFTSVHV